MKAFRPGSPWRGSGLLLGLLLGGLLLSPTASQDRAMQLQALKAAVPASQRRIAASVRAAVQMVSQNGMDAARAQVASSDSLATELSTVKEEREIIRARVGEMLDQLEALNL